MKKPHPSALLLSIALLLSACASDPMSVSAQPPAKRETSPPSPNETATAQSINPFAADLLARVGKEEKGNLIFSPYSISAAMAMTSAGARGNTLQQMNVTLHFPADQNALHDGMKSLHDRLAADPKSNSYELSIANALWGAQSAKFLDDFLSVTKKSYGGALRQVDFRASEAARSMINKWVEDQTHEKIKDLLPSGVIDAQTRLVITNAIYFRGDWTQPFEERSTRPAPFKLSDGTQVSVPMMNQEARFNYKEWPEAQALELGYRGDELSMVIILPRAADGLAALEAAANADNLKLWTTDMRRQEVVTSIPKFKITGSFNLAATLAAMGMGDAFGDRADFSGMTREERLFISAVLHKAFIEVNEKGTEAAAATGAVMRPTSMPVRQATFRADHPFLFFIRERQTGTILFMGRVANPS